MLSSLFSAGTTSGMIRGGGYARSTSKWKREKRGEKKEMDTLAPFALFCATHLSRGNKGTRSRVLGFLTAENHRRFLFATCFRLDAKGGKQEWDHWGRSQKKPRGGWTSGSGSSMASAVIIFFSGEHAWETFPDSRGKNTKGMGTRIRSPTSRSVTTALFRLSDLINISSAEPVR